VKARWLSGTLTNFNTIRSRIVRMNKLNQMERMGDFDILPKKEVLKLKAERDKLEANLSGIKDMRTLPGALFVVDPRKESIAVHEARCLNIPIVGIVDTNCDPDDVDYCIAANDDAIRAVKLISAGVADAVIEAKGGEQFSLAPETAGADETVDMDAALEGNVRARAEAAARETSASITEAAFAAAEVAKAAAQAVVPAEVVGKAEEN